MQNFHPATTDIGPTANPYAAPGPVSNEAILASASGLHEIGHLRLVQIAHALNVLNVLTTIFVVSLLALVAVQFSSLESSHYLIVALLQTSTILVGIFVLLLIVPILFCVYPALVAIMAVLALVLPVTWPLTLFAVNARAREILVANGMSVNVFGKATYVAQPVDGPPIKSNQFGLFFGRVMTYLIIAILTAIWIGFH